MGTFINTPTRRRLFPELERGTRERIVWLLAQRDGAIFFRGEFNDFPAVDGQAGTVLRALREHQMAPDAAFLKRTWPKIKLATLWLINKDGTGDGFIKGNANAHTRLTPIGSEKLRGCSGLYLAAVGGSGGDGGQRRTILNLPFEVPRQILEKGRKNFRRAIVRRRILY